jgi:hypothetical protein
MVRARNLRTQQCVTCQCQFYNPIGNDCSMNDYYQRIPLVDKSTTALLASFNYSFMESLILAQDERWRRA